MQTVTQIADAMQYILSERANELGRSTGFIQRQRKLTGATFCQSLVFGWLAKSDASMEELSQSAANVNVDISRQGLNDRFTPQAANFLKAVLDECVKYVIGTNPVKTPVLSHFKQIYLIDSTTVTLPDELESIWRGCDNSALKISVCWEIICGTLQNVHFHHAREHDQMSTIQQQQLPEGSLRLSDLGYFNLDVLQNIAENGSYWVTRYKQGTILHNEDGNKMDLAEYLDRQSNQIIDIPVQVGAKHRISCRLIAERVPDDILKKRQSRLKRWESKKQKRASVQRWKLLAWTIYLTNVQHDLLNAIEVLAIGRVRWQIELLFKLWKDTIDIDDWNTQNPWRILCELYAKLIACVIQHWLMLVGGVHDLSQSMVQAVSAIRNKSWQLAEFINNRGFLIRTIRKIGNILKRGCRISTSTTSPPTFQLFYA